METEIKKWGNSLAVRLPKNIIQELNLVRDEKVSLQIKGKNLIIQSQTKEKKLKRLLENITKQKEIEWGESVGKEW